MQHQIIGIEHIKILIPEIKNFEFMEIQNVESIPAFKAPSITANTGYFYKAKQGEVYIYGKNGEIANVADFNLLMEIIKLIFARNVEAEENFLKSDLIISDNYFEITNQKLMPLIYWIIGEQRKNIFETLERLSGTMIYLPKSIAGCSSGRLIKLIERYNIETTPRGEIRGLSINIPDYMKDLIQIEHM